MKDCAVSAPALMLRTCKARHGSDWVISPPFQATRPSAAQAPTLKSLTIASTAGARQGEAHASPSSHSSHSDAVKP